MWRLQHSIVRLFLLRLQGCSALVRYCQVLHRACFGRNRVPKIRSITIVFIADLSLSPSPGLATGLVDISHKYDIKKEKEEVELSDQFRSYFMLYKTPN